MMKEWVLKHPQMQQLHGAHMCSWVGSQSSPIHRWISVSQEGMLHEKSKGHSLSRGHLRGKTGQVCSHRLCVFQLQWMVKHYLAHVSKLNSQQFQCCLKNPFCRKWTQLSVKAHYGLVQIMDFTCKVALVRNIQKGALCLCFPICLLVYLSFYFKIVHSNSTALSFQQYICICTCIATNPSLCSPLSSAKEVHRKNNNLWLVLLWTPTLCPELCYTDRVSGYYSSREMNCLSEYWTTWNPQNILETIHLKENRYFDLEQLSFSVDINWLLTYILRVMFLSKFQESSLKPHSKACHIYKMFVGKLT